MKKTKLLAPLLILPLLSGCVSQMPEAVQGEKTQNGAAIGAVAGAILGAVTSKHHKGKNAAIGAAAGAALGGVIGYNMDQQAAEVAKALDTQVDNSPGAELNRDQDIIVTNNDKYVKITFREAMMFPTNSSRLTSSARAKISKLVSILQNYPTTLVQVVGHTDNRGSHSYNQKLSEKRAGSVANIIRQSGIQNSIYKRGCSFDKPVVPNTTPSNMSLNRRVEIFLYPSQEFVVDQCI
jgi:outer membrane protein OmpA-like peptidoglycan-associated protein